MTTNDARTRSTTLLMLVKDATTVEKWGISRASATTPEMVSDSLSKTAPGVAKEEGDQGQDQTPIATAKGNIKKATEEATVVNQADLITKLKNVVVA